MARLPREGPRPVDARGRMTLPPEILDHLGIPNGGHVAIEKRSGYVTLRKVDWK